ncbi:MAG: S41 family peptidase, partial [Pseudomonadota bacterium]
HGLIKSLLPFDGCLQDKALFTGRLDATTKLLLSSALFERAHGQATKNRTISQGAIAKTNNSETIEDAERAEPSASRRASPAVSSETSNRPIHRLPVTADMFDRGLRMSQILSLRREQIAEDVLTGPRRLDITSLRPLDLMNGVATRQPMWTRFSNDGRTALVVVERLESSKRQVRIVNLLMRMLIERNPDDVILDLSRLPGGAVNEASRILSYFLRRSHRTARSYHRRSVSRAHLNKLNYKSPSRRANETSAIRQFRKVRRRNGLYTLRSRSISFGNPSYKGRITVLVSPKTRSAATIMALILQQQANATVVGYQNGGDTETSCFAAPGVRRLPNTKILVNIPTLCYRRGSVKGKRGGPLKVDIEVAPETVGSGNFLPAIYNAAADHILAKR